MMQEITSAPAAAGTMPKTGRWGWYKDHTGAEFMRATSLVKKVETDREGLDRWFRYTVAVGMAQRDDLVLAVKAIGPPPKGGYTKEQKKDLGEIAEKALEAGKQGNDGGVKGTAVHTLTERVDRGEDIERVCEGLPAAYSVAVRNYRALIELNGWEVLAVERTIVNDRLGVAGTLDRIYRVPGLTALLGPGICQYDGPHHGHSGEELDDVIGDVKSEGDPTRNGLHIGPQLAIYSRAERMWVPDAGGRYVDMPCVRQDVAVVVHVDQLTGDVNPLFVDLGKGWRLAERAGAQRLDEQVARRKLGVTDGFFAEVPNVKKPKMAQSFVETMVPKQLTSDKLTADATTTLGPAPSLATAALDAARANDIPGTMAALHRAEAAEQVAVRGADGNVSWTPSPATIVGALDEVDKSAIEVIWAAGDLAALGKVWEIYTQTVGRTWGGRVAEAADSRRRQIECPQRALHTGNGKCACGWNGSQGFPA